MAETIVILKEQKKTLETQEDEEFVDSFIGSLKEAAQGRFRRVA